MLYLSWGHANSWAVRGCVRLLIVKISIEGRCVGISSSFEQVRQPACTKVSPLCISALPPPFREVINMGGNDLPGLVVSCPLTLCSKNYFAQKVKGRGNSLAQTLVQITLRTLGKVHEINKGDIHANVCIVLHKGLSYPLSPKFLSISL